MKFGLDAIRSAMARENEIVSYPHILIAGTNGKGQTSALFSNALQLSGYHVGLFTSPHLVDFRERIRIDGQMLPFEEMIQIGQQVLAEYGGDAVPEFCGTALTYFECCLMMALKAFRSRVSAGVFEVGLGGRLDATNALNPGLSIITSISRDHEEYLGHETSQIAREKAGIMRPGCPVVCGRTETDVLREEAQKCSCSSFDALGASFEWEEENGLVILSSRFGRHIMHGAEKLVHYQRDNASVALFALLKAQEMGIFSVRIENVFRNVIQDTRWVGRMWSCSADCAQNLGVCEVVLDGAHNPDGVRAFIDAVLERRQEHARALVVNSCADKDIDAMFPQYLQAFAKDNIFVVPVSSTKRACAPVEYCQKTGLSKDQACVSLREGIERAASVIGKQGTVYISGSLYLIGEAISALNESDCLTSIQNSYYN